MTGMSGLDLLSDCNDEQLEYGERFSMDLYELYWLYLPYPLTAPLSFRYDGVFVFSLNSVSATEASFGMLVKSTALSDVDRIFPE